MCSYKWNTTCLQESILLWQRVRISASLPCIATAVLEQPYTLLVTSHSHYIYITEFVKIFGAVPSLFLYIIKLSVDGWLNTIKAEAERKPEWGHETTYWIEMVVTYISVLDLCPSHLASLTWDYFADESGNFKNLEQLWRSPMIY